MVEVANLESKFRHYLNDAGTVVLHGKENPSDTGVMQVNCDHWCSTANRLGYDLNNIVDNVKMARYIYDTQGITAWVTYNTILAKR